MSSIDLRTKQKQPAPMSFAQSLQAARDAKGLTQAELARKAQVAISTINYAEGSVRGGNKRHTLRFETLKKILRSLELSPDSKEFRKLALEWFTENLQTTVSADDLKTIDETSRNPPVWQMQLSALQRELAVDKNAHQIELIRWASRNERAMGVLKTLKHFEEKSKKK